MNIDAPWFLLLHPSRKPAYLMFAPLNPTFMYTVKLGFTGVYIILLLFPLSFETQNITKRCLFKYTENFTTKKWKFSDKKKKPIFFIFLLKT